ncbi:hypothetical protein MACK_002325 [Theileria orientalis]|uniref:Uncharacterized protein n=1 Tax=Theileria orientalis TaxID=68886 RepID=A0A976MBG4_THEOR|nr:hypothetical protein MACK_002325 [Theileria orientalis]
MQKLLEHIAEKAKRDATRKPADVELLQASLMHHVLRETSYKAQLFDMDGTKPASPPPTLSITVTEVNCHKSYTNAGYRCFQHLLMSAENIEDVGGLKLAVFDGPGKQEIALCTGDKTAKNGKIDQITYTTCKGDLYVFFYGEDPRPLLLCYDGHAYRPTSMAGYCKTWVKVDGETVGTGELDIPFRADPKVLKALYDVSRFMNPVKLCLGQGAYQKLDPQHGQQQQSEQSEGPKPAKQEWTYTIDTNPKPPVCVRVTGIDLRCYKQYVHRPAIDGYRLGKVTYVEAKGGASVQPGTCTASQTGPGGPSLTCPQGAAGPGAPAGTPYCFEYDSSRQLWSVCVYYYMYDKDHNWPLVVELGFRGQSSEFFRLCCAGDNGAGSTAGNGVNGANGECKAPKGLRWVKMAHTTQKTGSPIANNSCKNGAASSTTDLSYRAPTPQTTDARPPHEDRKETCKKDAEFVKRAREIHHAIYSDQSPSSVFLGDRVPLESDLNDLIERRALEIRTQLNIEYGEKTKERLILATDKFAVLGGLDNGVRGLPVAKKKKNN